MVAPYYQGGQSQPRTIDPKALRENTDQRLILLFGMPRSGTTWLGKSFDSHPQTLYRHEPDTWRRLDMPRYPDVGGVAQYADLIRSYAAGLADMRAPRVAAKKPTFAKDYYSGIEQKFVCTSTWIARLASQLVPEFPVFFHTGRHLHPSLHVVWKSIESLGRLRVMLEALPSALAIHLIRHPCGYIASVLRGERMSQFVSRVPASEDYSIFSAASRTALGRQYGLSAIDFPALTPEERLAWQWVLLNDMAYQDCQSSGRYLHVFYEDVCLDPTEAVGDMFAFAGLDLTAQTRAFLLKSTRRTDSGYYSVFRNPAEAAIRWQHELDASTVNRIMAIVRHSRFAARYAKNGLQRSGS